MLSYLSSYIWTTGAEELPESQSRPVASEELKSSDGCSNEVSWVLVNHDHDGESVFNQ